MSFVQPNTNVWLMKGCHLRPDYQDTYYFSSAAQQFSYLTRGLIREYNNQTYQRYAANIIQVKGKVNDLFAANYMAFENSEHENRIFYAFVTDVEYVNENTVRIHYQIDYMQSFLFDFQLKDCFVERMHSKTDEIGDNIVAEPVKLGEMFKRSLDMVIPELTPYAVLYTNVDVAGNPYTSPDFVNGIYSPVRGAGYSYTQSGLQMLTNAIGQYVSGGHTEGILSVEIRPKFNVEGSEGAYTIKPYSTTLRFTKPDGSGNFSGYIPKNKKMWTYPYNYLCIAGTENEVSFGYEFFGSNPEFFMYCAGTPNDGIHLRPIEYQLQNIGEEDVVVTFPALPFNINTYEAWWARQRATLAPRIVGAGIAIAQTALNVMSFGALNSALAGASTSNMSAQFFNAGSEGLAAIDAGNRLYNDIKVSSARRNYHNTNQVATTIGGVLNDIVSTWAEAEVEKLNQISTRGNFNDMSEFLSGRYTYRAYNVELNAQEAERIDDFFTVYGYAQGKIMEPSIRNRTGWTYIKTAGCELYSNTAHNGILDIIAAIFNNGIRFWVAGSAEIGDYSGNNSPIGG